MTGKRFPFKLTTEQGKRIINIACSKWKETLANEWGKDFILNGYTYISEDYYREMRSACTEEQHQVFDEIFGSDAPKYKIGDYIYILDTGSTIESRLKDTNKEHFGAKVGDVVQIQGITNRDGCASSTDPRYYGTNFNLRAKDFRLATPEEIKKAKCPYKDGELILVRGSDSWVLRYATGRCNENGHIEFYIGQRKTGITSFAEDHRKVPEGFVLPS